MGVTIRPVYLHVSATVAGMLLLYAAAGLGLLRTAGLLPRFDAWLRRVWMAGVVMFALGYALSLLAAQVFLVARMLYFPAYAFGINGIRTALWLIAFAATLVLYALAV